MALTRVASPCGQSVWPVRVGPCGQSVWPVRVASPCGQSVWPVRVARLCRPGCEPRETRAPGRVPGPAASLRAARPRPRAHRPLDSNQKRRAGFRARCAVQKPAGAERARPRPASHARTRRAVGRQRPASIDLGTVPGPTAHRAVGTSPAANIPRKEVIQPQLPLRLPCYDFVPVAGPTLGVCVPKVRATTLGVTDSHDVTGGVYKARERIHRSMADLRLLATPASCRRVSACNPN